MAQNMVFANVFFTTKYTKHTKEEKRDRQDYRIDRKE